MIKQKLVYYYDMFDPSKTFRAENKLYTHWEMMQKHMTLRYLLTGDGDPKHFCKCNYAKFLNGVCTRCKHSKEHHNRYCYCDELTN